MASVAAERAGQPLPMRSFPSGGSSSAPQPRSSVFG